MQEAALDLWEKCFRQIFHNMEFVCDNSCCRKSLLYSLDVTLAPIASDGGHMMIEAQDFSDLFGVSRINQFQHLTSVMIDDGTTIRIAFPFSKIVYTNVGCRPI